MDKLAKQLREDAGKIDATISAELDDRIRASLQGVTPESANARRRVSRSNAFWWVSSLTGAAVAIAIIVVVNLQVQEPVPFTPQTAQTPLVLPKIEWHARTAVLTSPLEQEIEDLQADLKKAEQAVKEDIDRLF
jgi:anti-sigma-K factor RskA